MKRKFVEAAKNAIIRRVKFHAPIVFDDTLNTSLLSEFGVDVSLPVFKFDKPLESGLVKAFREALKEEKFNLLIDTTVHKSKKSIEGALCFDQSFPLEFLQGVNKLNINYPSNSNYDVKFREKFFKVGEKILNPQFEDFALKQTIVEDEIVVDYREFVLSGSNFFVCFQNNSDNEKHLKVELNIPLEKGYFFFKKVGKSLLVENLLTKEKRYLNFCCKNAKFSFSGVDGLENSVFACINVKMLLTLHKKQSDFVFFNFSDQKFSVCNECEVKNLQKIAFKKCCEIFDVRVKTKNPKFDFFFNHTLPQKIWINWLNFESDTNLEEKYLTYKRLFVRADKGLSFVPFHQIGVREIGVFNGEYFKKILVVSGNETFLRVGKTIFHNISGITNHTLKSAEPVVLCFGEQTV